MAREKGGYIERGLERVLERERLEREGVRERVREG